LEAARRRAAQARRAAERREAEAAYADRQRRQAEEWRVAREGPDVLLADARRAHKLAVQAGEQMRHQLVDRDRKVAELREAGWSWARLARELGVTRQALMKRDMRSLG